MEQIVRMYGQFMLAGIAVVSLTVFLFCGIVCGEEKMGLLDIMGKHLQEENEKKEFDMYTDFKEVYVEESLKNAPQIQYVAGALDTGVITLSQVIKAVDYAGEELQIEVLGIKNMEEEELIEDYNTETMEIELRYAGIYTVLVRAVDDGNRMTQCSIRMPVNSRVIQEEGY